MRGRAGAEQGGLRRGGVHRSEKRFPALAGRSLTNE